MKKNSSRRWRNQLYLYGAMVLTVVVGIVLFIIWRKPLPKTLSGEPRLMCTRLEPKRIIDRQPAVVPVYKLAWPHNETLLVYFDQNLPALKKKIIGIANEWSKYCGMSFSDTSDQLLAQIRVSFRGTEYASAVGKESVHGDYKGQPTMLLGGLDTMKDERNFRRIVLHEFGHALGLEHELKNPHLKIPWDTAAVYKYYLDHFKWNKDKVLKNVLSPLEVEQYKKYDEFDSTSIMIYAIPDTLTKGRFKIDWAFDLSDTDKKGIGKWYPKNLAKTN